MTGRVLPVKAKAPHRSLALGTLPVPSVVAMDWGSPTRPWPTEPLAALVCLCGRKTGRPILDRDGPLSCQAIELRADSDHVLSRRAFLTLDHIELNLLTFTQ